jgi:ferredoxin/flavodoxin
MNVLCFYFSGTGNTYYVVKKIKENLNKVSIGFEMINIENFDKFNDNKIISNSDVIMFAYPIYGSMAPIILRDFIENNKESFNGKKAIVIITQYLFSGDGGAYLARILRKNGMDVIVIEHFDMPSNLADADIFPIKNGLENKYKLEKADKKIENFSFNLINKNYKKTGDNFFSFLLGSIQRVPFSIAEKKMKKSIKINNELCINCGLCIKNCPMKNLYEEDKLLKHNNNCTFCYRCINLCPKKAISLFANKKPKKQYTDFLNIIH